MSGPIIETVQTHAEAGKAKGGMVVTKWVKTHWTLPLLLLLAADFYWILWGDLTAIIVGIVLLGVIGIDVLILKRSTIPTLKRYWPVIAILAIISLSMYIRLFGYFTADGGTRWPYLRNIDSYHFYRLTNMIVENNGIMPPHDSLVLPPQGSPTSFETYAYISAYSYTLFNFYNASLWIFLAAFSALIASLVAIPSYYIGKFLFDRKAGVITALFMIFATSFMSRSLGGDPDSDAIAMLFVMISVAAFLFMYKKSDKNKIFAKRNILPTFLFSLAMTLFAYIWGGYWFTFWIAGAFVFVKIIFDFIFHRKHREDHLRITWKHTKSLLILFIASILVFEVLTVPYYGPQFAGNFITTPLGALLGGEYKGEIGQFPNVLVSVAEMQAGGDARAVAINAAGLDTAASVSGLPLGLLTIISPFLLTLACFVYLGYSYYKRREHLDTLLFMGVWFVGFLFASTIAVRFTIFLAPVYAICSGIMLAKLWRVTTGEDRSLGA